MDNADAIEAAQISLNTWFDVAHKTLNWWEILGIVLEACPVLRRLADDEYIMNMMKGK